jgi:hypothetical protein
VAGCVLTHLGDDGVKVNGEHNGVQSCDIVDVSSGGVMLEGGDRKTLAPGGNFARNNHIRLFSRWVRTYKHAIGVEGVGQHIAHNVMHEAPQEAMFFRGNDHLIEYNEIYDICRETGDVGAIHTGRNWTWQGNVLRHNYIHDILGPGLHGSMGIYLDDFMCGTTIFGNVFVRAGRAAFIGGGRDNTIENNLFIECAPSVHVDARGTSWAAYYFDGTYPVLFTSLEEVHGREPPYVDRYPKLRTILDGNPAIPEGNRVLRNVSWGGRWLDLHDRVTLKLLTIEGNVISDPDLGSQLAPEHTGPDDYYLNVESRAHRRSFRFGDPWLTAELEGTGNVWTSNDGPSGCRRIPRPVASGSRTSRSARSGWWRTSTAPRSSGTPRDRRDRQDRSPARRGPNQCWVLRQMRTRSSITGTSIKTPTTVARDAPDDSPKSMVDVAMATSKWLEAPIMDAGAASRYSSRRSLARP